MKVRIRFVDAKKLKNLYAHIESEKLKHVLRNFAIKYGYVQILELLQDKNTKDMAFARMLIECSRDKNRRTV